MRDAFSGIYNIIFVVVFLVVIMGLFGLIVSYTKAFKMKNIVISTVEQYDGYGCDKESDCFNKINEEASRIGYNPTELRCPTIDGVKLDKVENLYCLGESLRDGNKYVYKVVTQVDVNIPIINKMMGLKIFQVSGDTDIIYRDDDEK